MIDLFKPYIPFNTSEAVAQVLKTRWIGQGPRVDQFEQDFMRKFNVPHAAAVNSGTSALETAYDLCGLGPGDEVITTPLTCTATNLPLVRRGCKIVWADINPNTLCIDPYSVGKKITDKTKAIVQVHLGGINALVPEAQASGIVSPEVPVISDACQALGIFTGNYTCCSFQAIKHITTGDGGMIVTPFGADHRTAKLLRWFGIDRDKKIEAGWQAYKNRKMTFDIELPGAKRQMNDIAASMGIAGLMHYDYIIYYRETLFKIYQKELHDVTGVRLVDGPDNKYWLATLIVEDRDNFAKMMYDKGIDTNVVQVRNDIYKIFGGVREDLPNMDALEEKYISIPIGMHVTHAEARFICKSIKEGW